MQLVSGPWVITIVVRTWDPRLVVQSRFISWSGEMLKQGRVKLTAKSDFVLLLETECIILYWYNWSCGVSLEQIFCYRCIWAGDMLQVWYAVTAAGAWCLLYISRVVLFLSSLCHSQFTRFSPYRNRLWAQWPLLSISVSIETSRLSLHNISWCHPTLNLRPLRPPPTISSCQSSSVPITQRGRRKWRCNLFAQVSGQSSQRKLCPSPTTVSGSASSSCTCSNTTSTGPSPDDKAAAQKWDEDVEGAITKIFLYLDECIESCVLDIQNSVELWGML